MAEGSLFWKQVEQRESQVAQAHDGPALRGTSSIVVQIPQTGERIVMERGFTPELMEAQVHVSYVSASTFHAAETCVWIAGVALVLLFRLAVRKLKAWVEVGLVMAFLGLDVVLDLVSPTLADDLLMAGVSALGVLAALRVVRACPSGKRA